MTVAGTPPPTIKRSHSDTPAGGNYRQARYSFLALPELVDTGAKSKAAPFMQ